jgi:hypothetical protein
MPLTIPGVDFVFITDDLCSTPDGWQIIKTKFFYRDPRRTAKLFKLLPHLFFKGYEISVWIDANRLLKSDIISLATNSMESNLIAIFAHNKRKDILEEAKECIKRGKDDKSIINNQIKSYMLYEGIKRWGLYSGSFIIRKHNDEKIISLMAKWWKEIELNSVRDQLSLPFVISQSGLKPFIIPGNVNHNDYFETIPHKKSKVYTDKINVRMRKYINDFVWILIKMRMLIRNLR